MIINFSISPNTHIINPQNKNTLLTKLINSLNNMVIELRYLEEGDNGAEVLLVLIERHVLKTRASIGKARVIRSEEDGDS